MGNGAMENQNQDMYGALEKNKTLEKQVRQGQCNVDTKKAQTNNIKTSYWQKN